MSPQMKRALTRFEKAVADLAAAGERSVFELEPEQRRYELALKNLEKKITDLETQVAASNVGLR